MACVAARLSVFKSIPWMFSQTYLACRTRCPIVGVQYFSMKVKPPPPSWSSDHDGIESNSSSNVFEEPTPSSGPHRSTLGNNSIPEVRKFKEGKHVSPRMTAQGPPKPWKKSNGKGLSQVDRGNTDEFNSLRDDDFEMAHKRSQKSDHDGIESNSNSNDFDEPAPSSGPHRSTLGNNSIQKVRKFQEGKHVSPRMTAQGPPQPWKKSNWKRSSPVDRGNTDEFNSLRDDDFETAHERSKKPNISEGSEILFGVAPCHLAISQCRRKFLTLFLKLTLKPKRPEILEILSKAEAHGVPVQYVKTHVLNSLCSGRVHQGVCMEVTPLLCKRLEEAEGFAVNDGVCLEKQQLWLVLEGIQDPMNMGAVLRTAYFLGIDKVVKSQTNSCPLTPVVSKASAGTVELMETFETDNLLGFLQAKSQQGWQVVGTVGNTPDVENTPVITTAEFEWKKPTVLVLGNEGTGLSSEIKSLCEMMLTVPSGRNLPPGIESLNVSVAAGIILHGLCLKRTQ